MRIELSQGHFAIIDKEDFELVRKYKWRISKTRTGLYAKAWSPMINYKRKLLLLHRVIGESAFQDITNKILDHIDGNGLNNVRANLRVVNRSQNCMNKTVSRKGMSSKYKGVSFRKDKNRWRASIFFNGRAIEKSFKTELDAGVWYNEKAIQLFGQYARINAL
jgi:hypothetical protein